MIHLSDLYDQLESADDSLIIEPMTEREFIEAKIEAIENAGYPDPALVVNALQYLCNTITYGIDPETSEAQRKKAIDLISQLSG